MSKSATKKTKREESLEKLRKWMPKGSTVYTILRHVSRSGMQRVIGVVVIDHANGTSSEPIVFHPNHAVASVLDWSMHPKIDGVKVSGCGMDMGFHLVYQLSSVLHGDGYALKQQWL